MTRLLPFRGVRTRLFLVVVGTLTVGLVLAAVGFNILLSQDAEQDANAVLRSRAAAELALIRIVGNRIHVTPGSDEAIDSGVWIFRGMQNVQRPRARPETDLAAQSMANGPTRFFNVPNTEERLYAVPIADHGRRVGTLVTGVSVAPYRTRRRTAFTASVTIFVLVLVFASSVAWWLLRSALRPVAEMTAQAGAWSEEDLDGRFALGEPHDELTLLAGTLDGLLDRLAASLRHERRFSAEMSHELRTPLAKLMAEAELALRRERSESEYRESLAAVLSNA